MGPIRSYEGNSDTIARSAGHDPLSWCVLFWVDNFGTTDGTKTMINSGATKINCPVCGHSDWYLKGRHRACRPCQALAARRYRLRQALGQGRERQGRAARPLSASLTLAQPVAAVARRERQTCRQGHAYSSGNTRWQTDRQGRVSRVCRQCHREAQRARYGMPRPTPLADMLSRQAEQA